MIDLRDDQLLDVLPLIKRELERPEIRNSRRPEDVEYVRNLRDTVDAIERELGPPTPRSWGDGRRWR